MRSRPSPHSPSVRLCVLAALLPLLLGACAENLVPAQALLVAGAGWAAEPALAVETNGAKHIVWSECARTSASTTRCKIVYWRTGLGPATRQIDMAPLGSDERYDLPDVAVTADGQAYVAWRFHIGDAGPYRYYYSMVRPDGSYDSPNVLEVEAGAEGPRLAARGNVVYALYHTMPDIDNVWLRYLRLRPLDLPNYLANSSNSIVGAASMAIDSGGGLHAAWKYAGPRDYQALFYGKPGMIQLLVDDMSPSMRYSAPAIAIDSADTAHVAFATYGATTDTLTRWTHDSGGAEAGFTVPLAAAHNPWRIHGSPRIATEDTTPVIAFSARNGATANDEIWVYSPPASGPDNGPSRITTNTWQDDEPQVAQLDSMTVIAWRTYESSGSASHTGPSCQGDLYEYDPRGLRRVFASPGAICAAGGRLAGNGDWAAGVWIDSQSAGSSRPVPWTTFNSYTAYMPLMQR